MTEKLDIYGCAVTVIGLLITFIVIFTICNGFQCNAIIIDGELVKIRVKGLND